MSHTKTLAVIPRVAPIRRIVTGHNAQGRAIVVSDESCPHVDVIMGIETCATTELWTTQVPADNAVQGDPVTLPHRIAPPVGGAVFRVVEFPPDREWKDKLQAGQKLLDTGDKNQSTNPMLHRTESVDFVMVLAGEIYSVLDEGEVLMRAGDVMVQRGTNHAWENRSEQPCRVGFVLIDAVPIPV
ncbi:Cupin domain-containing protein [Pseudomonas sp. NFIX10]|uniref:cupin domain-containing protein n=1 Tax=unclassified Pseudomonas TaxID=196821 RepID=UPI0008E5D65D|nr:MULTISPECIES: cupin domain-containing protein [unclassified Pseudomonas]SFA92454.1 Cupin domain-containing protein [Pseudomonas sp. NFIX10]SFE37864.1 Cupin domain-containing protein [Pseudomonas sp. NFACC06-1]